MRTELAKNQESVAPAKYGAMLFCDDPEKKRCNQVDKPLTKRDKHVAQQHEARQLLILALDTGVCV